MIDVNKLIRQVDQKLMMTDGERIELYTHNMKIRKTPTFSCSDPYQIASFPELLAVQKLAVHSSHWFKEIEPEIKVGKTLHALDENYYDYCREHHLYPGALGYDGFPKASCISVNSVIAHGLPLASYKIKRNDLVKLDVVFCDSDFNFIDIANTYVPPKSTLDSNERILMRYSRLALEEAIRHCRIGASITEPARIFEKYASDHGITLIKTLHSHFVRRGCVHAGLIPNSVTKLYADIKFKEGMIFSLEPLYTLGESAMPVTCQAGMAFKTESGSPAVHFERTCVMTGSGAHSLHVDL